MKACSCFRMIPYRGAPVSTAVTIPVESHWAAHQRWCTHRNVDQGCSLWICCMLPGTQSGRSGCNGRCGAARVHYEQTGKAWLASQILPHDCWQLEWYHQFPRGTAVKRWWLWIKHSKSIEKKKKPQRKLSYSPRPGMEGSSVTRWEKGTHIHMGLAQLRERLGNTGSAPPPSNLWWCSHLLGTWAVPVAVRSESAETSCWSAALPDHPRHPPPFRNAQSG